MTNHYIIYITAADNDEARAIGRILVESKLAACVNIFPPVTSIYWWDEKIEQNSETVIIGKTRGDKLEALKEKVKKIHSYDCPCIVATKIENGNEDYLKWIDKSLS